MIHVNVVNGIRMPLVADTHRLGRRFYLTIIVVILNIIHYGEMKRKKKMIKPAVDKICPYCCTDATYDEKRNCYVCIPCANLGCNRIDSKTIRRKEENRIYINKRPMTVPPPYEERYELHVTVTRDKAAKKLHLHFENGERK